MLRAIFVFCVVLSVTLPASAQSTGRGDATTIAAAEDYLEAYETLDLARLAPRYADSATFTDPTSLHVASIGGPFLWHGRREILAGIEAWKRGGVSSLHYEVEDVYEASGCVVFIGTVSPTVSTPEGDVQFRYRIVTVVTIEDGRVTEHRDYTDYGGATQLSGAAPQ